MFEFVGNQLAGLIVGLAGSLLFWWAFAHFFVPRLKFEDRIRCRPDPAEPGSTRYWVKISNQGKRDLIDVSMIAILSFQIHTGRPKRRTNPRIAFHRNGETTHQIPVLPARDNRLLTLHARYSAQIVADPNFQSMRVGLQAGKLDLLDLLLEGVPEDRWHYVQIHVFGYDRWSGTRKLFSSPAYYARDFENFEERQIHRAID